ncbi:MAG: polysaccharide deacetylase family protein [Prochloraceae cyanobacterium]
MQFAPLYPILQPILQWSFPNCLWSGVSSSKAIALTFDDGPHSEYTPELLKVLERYHVKASFFLLGNCVTNNSQLTKEIYQRGHWLGLHGYYHHSFPLLSKDDLEQSLSQTQQAIAKTCQLNPKAIRDVRPPNGLFTPNILEQLHQQSYRVVMWSVVPEDWLRPGIEIVRKRVLENVRNGALIVLHDGYHGGQDVAKITADLIPRLLERGYHFVTVNDLWQQIISVESIRLTN